MVFPKSRAIVAGSLFVVWLCFLAYLAFSNRDRAVVARPQLERSNLVALVRLLDDHGRPAAVVDVQKVLFAEDPEWQQLAGQQLELKELAFFSANQGWAGPGDYVVPLTRTIQAGKLESHVTLLPLSPGYQPATSEITVKIGDHAQSLAAGIAELIDVPEPRLRELFKAETVKLWHVPTRTDGKMLDQIIRKSGGEITALRLAEARIYPATPEVLEQVDRTR